MQPTNLKLTIFFYLLILGAGLLFSCGPSGSEKQAPGEVINGIHKKGEQLFIQHCSACHTLQHNSIGPRLVGISDQVSKTWIKDFILDPLKVIESGDARAKQMFDKYKTYMPSYAHLPEEEIDAIIAYLAEQKGDGSSAGADDTTGVLKDPIADTISLSNVVAGLEFIMQVPASDKKKPLARINKLDFEQETGQMYLLDLRGKLYKLDNNKPEVYLDMAKEMPDFMDRPGLGTGFGSFAFHPEFQKNGLLYTTHVEKPGSGQADFVYDDSIKVFLQWVVNEWKTESPGKAPFEGKNRELFRINMVGQVHGLQDIGFNPHANPGDADYGNLYINVGDGGAGDFGFPFLLNSREMPWGTIFRIDPAGNNSANGQYGIPEDNPFVNDSDPKTIREIYAMGFRNPHRTYWTTDGKMLVSHIGARTVDGFYHILPGDNAGWPVREGTFLINPAFDPEKAFPLPPEDSIYGYSYPVAQYDHGEGRAISLGYEYTLDNIPELKGKMLFGDIVTGRLFYCEADQFRRGSQANIYEWSVAIDGQQKPLPEICGSNRVDLRFGRNPQGEIFVFTKADGKVYKLTN